MILWRLSIALLWVVATSVVIIHVLWIYFGITTPTAESGWSETSGDIMFFFYGGINSIATVLVALFASRRKLWSSLLVSLTAILALGLLFILGWGFHGFALRFWLLLLLNITFACFLIWYCVRGPGNEVCFRAQP